MLLRSLKKASRIYQMKKNPNQYARSIGVVLGEDAWLVDLTDATFGSEPYLISLGNHVLVAAGVRFVTHDGGFWVFREDHPDIDVVGPIRIGNNVMIGLNAIILPGVTVGSNCVIGAGAVVACDIPDSSVAAGVPAKVISSTAAYWEKRRAGSTSNIKAMGAEQRREYLTKQYMSPRVPG